MSVLGLEGYDESPAPEESPAPKEGDAEPVPMKITTEAPQGLVADYDETVTSPLKGAPKPKSGGGSVRLHPQAVTPPVEASSSEVPKADEKAPDPFSKFSKPAPSKLCQMPASPLGACDPAIQEKVLKYLVRHRAGNDFIDALRKTKDFYNPAILEKLVEQHKVSEIGSNYPQELFNPHSYEDSQFYESLARDQNRLIERQKRAHAEREAEKAKQAKGESGSSGGSSLKAAAAAAAKAVESNVPPSKKTKWESSGNAFQDLQAQKKEADIRAKLLASKKEG